MPSSIGPRNSAPKELTDPNVLEAFRLANKVMAVRRQRRKDTTDPPKWRPFPLAFLLLNLTSIAEPENADLRHHFLRH